MGAMKQNPKYNVLSFRVSDEELKVIEAAINGGSKQNFLLAAALEKVLHDEDYDFRERVNRGLDQR
ncbi:MAG: hypothetical protein WA003_08630 [Desulfuromonadaceae bacterium]